MNLLHEDCGGQIESLDLEDYGRCARCVAEVSSASSEKGMAPPTLLYMRKAAGSAVLLKFGNLNQLSVDAAPLLSS